MQRRFFLVPAVVLALPLTACSELTESGPVADARNQAVCTTISQPLDQLSQNLDRVLTSPAGQVAGGALQTAESALQTATSTATGQLAADLLGLDQSLVALLSAWTAGAVPAELRPLIDAVKTDIAGVRADCK